MSFHGVFTRASAFIVSIRFTKHHTASLKMERNVCSVISYYSQVDLVHHCIPRDYHCLTQRSLFPSTPDGWMHLNWRMWLAQLTVGCLYNSNPGCKPSRGSRTFNAETFESMGNFCTFLTPWKCFHYHRATPSSCVQHILGKRSKHILLKSLQWSWHMWTLYF